jgi:hypothetical protein
MGAAASTEGLALTQNFTKNAARSLLQGDARLRERSSGPDQSGLARTTTLLIFFTPSKILSCDLDSSLGASWFMGVMVTS